MIQTQLINLSKSLDPLEVISNWIIQMNKLNQLGNILLSGAAMQSLLNYGQEKGMYRVCGEMINIYYPDCFKPIRYLSFQIVNIDEGLGILTFYKEEGNIVKPYYPSGNYKYSYMAI